MIPKFRVWFSEVSQMITDDLESINFFDETVTINSGYYDSFADDYIFGSIEVAIGNAILMQSTGLFDKNGKEIFEGDIVIAWSQGVKGTFEIKRRIDGLWLLYPAWKDGQFWYLSPTEDGQETCEVIGDIYENKELLGDTDD